MKSILIVDDDVSIVTILRDRLRSYGYAVSSAFDGKTALNTVDAEKPDCVLLDLEMPGMSGFGVLAALKKSHPELPILVVTASSSKPALQKALEAGAVGYLLKPFDPEALRSKVARAVRAHEALEK